MLCLDRAAIDATSIWPDQRYRSHHLISGKQQSFFREKL
jgi:hypothetical protein